MTMRFKNLLNVIVFSLFIVLMMPLHSSAMRAGGATTTIALPTDSATDSQVAAKIINRVNEIQSMDKSNLSPDEKRVLRKELTGLKKQAEGLDKKVYLSVGAIIIVILLLILILR